MAWQVDKAHTQVSFSIRHLGVSFIRATMLVADAELNLDEATPANSSLKGRIDMRTFTTHDASRDGHLKSAEFFDVENYPFIEFATRRVVDKGNGKFDVTGDLTIKDSTGEVTLEGEYAQAQSRLHPPRRNRQEHLRCHLERPHGGRPDARRQGNARHQRAGDRGLV